MPNDHFFPSSNFYHNCHSATTLLFFYLKGICGEDKANILTLRNGTSTSDQPAFVSDWTVAPEGAVCLPKRRGVCSTGAAMGCQALRSEVFEPCHAHIPVQVFLLKCEEQACEESDVCELISAYARLCRQSGVCVDWRSPHLCRKFFKKFFLGEVGFNLRHTTQLKNPLYSNAVSQLDGL